MASNPNHIFLTFVALITLSLKFSLTQHINHPSGTSQYQEMLDKAWWENDLIRHRWLLSIKCVIYSIWCIAVHHPAWEQSGCACTVKIIKSHHSHSLSLHICRKLSVFSSVCFVTSSGDNPGSLYAEILILRVWSQQWRFQHREIIYITLAHGEFHTSFVCAIQLKMCFLTLQSLDLLMYLEKNLILI